MTATYVIPGDESLFISEDAPTLSEPGIPYLWIQVDEDGNVVTFWVEDGN